MIVQKILKVQMIQMMIHLKYPNPPLTAPNRTIQNRNAKFQASMCS